MGTNRGKPKYKAYIVALKNGRFQWKWINGFYDSLHYRHQQWMEAKAQVKTEPDYNLACRRVNQAHHDLCEKYAEMFGEVEGIAQELGFDTIFDALKVLQNKINK